MKYNMKLINQNIFTKTQHLEILKTTIFSVLILLIFASCTSPKSSNREVNLSNISSETNFNDYIKNQLENLREGISENNNQEVAQDFYIRGLNEVSNNNYLGAIYYFQNALKFDKSPTIYISLTEAYMQISDSYNALESAINAYLLDNNNKRSLELMFTLFIFKNDIKSAEIVINELYSKFPTDDNLLLIADFYNRMHNLKAVTFYEKYLESNDNDDAERKLITLYYENKDTLKAIIFLEKSIAKHPSIIKYNDLTYLLIETKNYKKLKSFIITINQLDENTKSEIYRTLISEFYLSKDNITEIIADLREYLEQFKQINSNDPISNFYSSSLSFKIHDTTLTKYFLDNTLKNVDTLSLIPIYCSVLYSEIGEKTIQLNVLKKFRNVFPENNEYNSQLGFWYLQNRQYDSSLTYFEKFRSKEPENPDGYSLIGDVYNKMEKFKEAEENYLKALEKDDDNPTAHNNFAYFLSQFPDRLDEAENHSKISLEKEPKNAAFLDTYGWILYKKHKIDDAFKYINKALEIDSTNYEILEHLGDLYLEKGDIKNAIEFWQKSLKFDTSNLIIIEKIKKYKN